MIDKQLDPAMVGLPIRPFLYTLDQIGTLLSISEKSIGRHIHYEYRSPGPRPKHKLLARNIASEGESPEWRVAENELVRWLRAKGFRTYDRGWIGH